MMEATTPERSPLAEALVRLDEAMRPLRGSSLDPERRRVAVRLADLARCEDGDLSAFARRHLPGRAVDEPALRAAREMLLAIGRVLGPEGESAEALGALQGVHRVLDERLSEAKRAAAWREAEAAAAAAVDAAATGAPALVEASGPLSRPGAGLPFVAAPTAVSAPIAMFAPAPMAVSAPLAAPAPMAVPVPEPVPVAASAPRTEPPSSRAGPPVWDEETRPASKTLPEMGRLVDSALPFIPVASEERPRSAVARFDAALPFQPVAGHNGAPPHEIPPAAAHHGPAAPSLPLERPPVVAGPSAFPAAAPSAPPSAIPGAQPAPLPSAPPPSAPAPASTGDPLSARSTPPLTLNQYAGLVVACELYPAYVESTHARYGVPSPAARAALDAFWATRLAADPALAQRWPELCEAARRYFLQSR
ncbi:hypothetical protein [Sorangium sp. So ce362]|uniref:hypothetical protein n=1 Tax=Sorangium sp. So ce362 TaxID=3133303 RepID=UPI003F639CE2